jgi:acyl-CoA dehydrogenase
MSLASLVGGLALRPFAKALPPMGETERAALEAGTVGFEGKLFAGRPDFNVLRAPGPTSSAPRNASSSSTKSPRSARSSTTTRSTKPATCRAKSGSSSPRSGSSA